MSEIKPVSSNEHVSIKTANQEMSEWIRSGKTSTMSHGELYAFFERQEAKKLRAALEALQEKLDRMNGLYHTEVSKHQLDYNALQAENAAQTKRANALALVIRDLTKMVTHDAETKDQFIERVKKILSVDPDFRVSEFESALQAENERLKVDLYGQQESKKAQFNIAKTNQEEARKLLNEAYSDNAEKQQAIIALKYEIDGMTDLNATLVNVNEQQAKRIVLLECDVKHLKDALRAYDDEDIDED